MSRIEEDVWRIIDRLRLTDEERARLASRLTEPSSPPPSRWGQEMVWWEGLLRAGEDRWWRGEPLTEDLLASFVAATGSHNRSKRGSQTAMGRFLAKVCPGYRSQQRTTGGRRAYFAQLPPLSEARAAFERARGSL